MFGQRIAQFWVYAAILLITAWGGSLAVLGAGEPAIVPTVHPILSPTSAIPAPILFDGDHIAVWKDRVEQRLLITGRTTVAIGYRQLRADSAAAWITPSREAGESTFDVAVYLSGNVSVREGNSPNSTTTVGTELIVTTRVSRGVQLGRNRLPENKIEEDSPIFKRGKELRDELLSKPRIPLMVPRIQIIEAEKALQEGWIARGPNNRIIRGPGDIIAEGGRPTPGTRQQRPRPQIFSAYDRLHSAQYENESVTILDGTYLLYDLKDGRPPIEFRAQRMVLFSPKDVADPAKAATKVPENQDDISKVVTGAYMEGDVVVERGDQVTVRAERIYYDFTSQRAIMLDAVLETVDERRSVPLYMRAAEIRQVSRSEFAAKKVTFSTSEFFTPHYHIGASEVYLRDVSPTLSVPQGGEYGIAGAVGGADMGMGGSAVAKTWEFTAKDATINALGVPIFYWPYLAGDTGKNEIPLRTIRVSNSRTYGPSVLTDWDIFGLMGQREPEGFRADLNLDYFGKRGPGVGTQAEWKTDEDLGLLRAYGINDRGTDRLGKDREDILPLDDFRGRVTARDQHDFGGGLVAQLEASYISDPNFLEQFFQREFDSDKEPETSFYLKKQGETDAISILGKFSLFDFTSTADQVDDQYTTEKKPELKYWRIGDSFFDMFTYYSESGVANVHSNITNFTPQQLGLNPSFLGPPANVVPMNQKFRDYYRAHGWTTGDVIRGDSRHEIDMPLQLGDLKVVPYLAGRVTYWDEAFPESDDSGSTTRVWGGAGLRSSMEFSRVYDNAESLFLDVHRLRHIIEPQFNLFVGAADEDRRDLQPFDRDVEGITGASGMQLAFNQRWQTKRGGPDGKLRDVDWIVLNIQWNQFWNKDKTGTFFPQAPLRGFYFPTRPELSQVANSINVDGVWRVGERARVLGEASYSLDTHRIEQSAFGLAVDQTTNLSYFVGNRYIRALDSNEWTMAIDYTLTKKYQLVFAESFDFGVGNNILSSLTIVRRMPRLHTALTVTYDANNDDTSFIFTAWPEASPTRASAVTPQIRVTAGSTTTYV